MTSMRTVTGVVPVANMGFCQPHEHIFVSEGPGTRLYPALLADDIGKSTSEVMDYVSIGGKTLIDAQPMSAGGNFEALYQISRATGAYIVASSGFHLPHFYDKTDDILTLGEDALFDRFVGELETAGVVKTALGRNGLTDDMIPRFRAAGRAAAFRKVPVLIHTELGIGALEAVALLEKLRVPPSKVLVCHMDRQAEDFALHENVARTGAILEYDTIGRFKYHDDESEIRLINHMLARGYSLTMSLDTTSLRMLAYSGNIGLGYIIRNFIPALINSGVTKKQIDAMTRINPAKIFAND